MSPGRVAVPPLHPGAWWVWAIGLAVAATRTTNLVLSVVSLVVVAAVISACRTPSPLAPAPRFFAVIAASVVVGRLLLTVLFGTRLPGTELFALPQVTLPDWMAGMSLGGPVTVEAVLGALSLGMQLAVVIVAIGSVNALASPGRLLRSLPALLYELGVIITVALNTAPQTVLSAGRVRRARQLRGRPTSGPAGLRGIAVPVLEAAMERSIELAASMDARGYGRRTAPRGRAEALGIAASLTAIAFGLFLALAPGSSKGVGLSLIAVGVVALGAAARTARRRTARTRYRPLSWDSRAWALAVAGAAPVLGSVVSGVSDPLSLHPPLSPLAAPPMAWPALVGLLVALLPAIVVPASTTPTLVVANRPVPTP